MNQMQTLSRWLATPLVWGASIAVAADGDIQQVCNCNRGGGMAMPSAPIPEYMPPAMPLLAAEPSLLPAPLMGTMDPGAVAPPPGTLGRTYSLPTRLVPAEKHPRVGMLDVVATAEDVIVSDTKEFREEDEVKGFQDEQNPGVWHFETKPLLPGVPHVYKVELINGGVTTDVRYVRLIRGRIIELTF